MRLTKRLQELILRAVKEAETYDPIKAIPRIDCELTKEESQAIEKFLRWCIAKDALFGWNLPKVWFSWCVDTKRTNARRDQPVGMCRCIQEPMARNGLEGYNIGEVYRFERRRLSSGKRYVRVYNGEDGKYYECCGPRVFLRYFRPLEGVQA